MFKFTDWSTSCFETLRDFITGLTYHLFHLVDQRFGFFRQLDAFGPPIACAGLARNEPFLLQLIERTHQRRLFNTDSFRQLDLRLLRRQLVDVMQRDPVGLR